MKVMIREFLQKQAKMGLGVLNTYIRKKGRNYDDGEWWDASFYNKGISDRQTLSSNKSVITAKYHYASVEMQILKHLHNNGISINRAHVLDIGSGAGHWIDFYKTLEPFSITGMDISISSFKYLQDKYAEDNTIEIYQGKAIEVINKLNGDYDLVNAIGVMFHIVEDSEWENTIYAVGNILKKGGLFVVGGHFGLIDGLNVQIDKDGGINKRLRSKSHWAKLLKKVGFTKMKLYQNSAYLWIRDSLPENNVLIATK